MPDQLRRPHRIPALAVALGLLIAAMPAVAAAHAELISSTPAAGANLETAPTEVILTFDDELDPVGSGFTVHDHHGDQVGSGEVDLGVADRNVMVGAVSISEPGVYTVEWEVLGADGHEVSDWFSFGYATDEEIPDAAGHGHESPDTAMPSPSAPIATLAGVLMLLAGVAAHLVRGSTRA